MAIRLLLQAEKARVCFGSAFRKKIQFCQAQKRVLCCVRLPAYHQYAMCVKPLCWMASVCYTRGVLFCLSHWTSKSFRKEFFSHPKLVTETNRNSFRYLKMADYYQPPVLHRKESNMIQNGLCQLKQKHEKRRRLQSQKPNVFQWKNWIWSLLFWTFAKCSERKFVLKSFWKATATWCRPNQSVRIMIFIWADCFKV